ncbi:MAG: ABC transporter substrate-binding protein [Anaerolineae bacterium]|nr:ABC transporter substrate-binding protein [Anaerolineae bacterium]
MSVILLLVLMSTAAPRAVLAQDVACETDVVVQADDWLSKIAEKFYGDVLAFPAIAQATNAIAATDDSYTTIDNVDLIEIGWKLCIPSAADAEALLEQSLGSEVADVEFDGIIRIGAAVSETGSLAQAGEDTREGYDLWADFVNNEYGGIRVGDQRYGVEMIYYDDESDPDTAANLVERLITQDQVQFLFGPYSSGLTMSTSAVAEQHNVIFIEGNGASETIFERGFQNLFATLTPASYYTKSAVEMLAERGVQTIAIAHEDAAFATSVLQGTQRWAEELGLEVVAVETYPVGATVAELDPIVTKLKALNPDAFVGGGHLNDGIAFVRSSKSLEFCPQAMVLTAGPNFPEFAEELGADAENILGPTQWEATMGWVGPYLGTPPEYDRRYQALHGSVPSYQSAESTAVGLALQAAIEAAGSLETDAVRQALRDLDIVTFYGPINFDETGKNADKPMATGQVQEGAFTVVAPSVAAVTDFKFEPLAWCGGS